MSIDEFCGIVVVTSLVFAVTMFVILIIKINRPPQAQLKQARRGLLRMGNIRSVCE